MNILGPWAGKIRYALLFLVLAALAFQPACAQFAPLGASLMKDRISGPVFSSPMETARGSKPGWVALATDQGALSGPTTLYGLQLVFQRSVHQEADLENLLEQQHTSGSAVFHHWLKPAQFAARYGASQHDLQSAAAWLQSQGLVVDQVPPSNDRILFHGTVTQINAAFRTEVHQYTFQGTSGFSNAHEISLPHALTGVFHLEGLHTVPLFPRYVLPHARSGASTNSPLYSPATQSGTQPRYLVPDDVQTIYDIKPLYNGGYTGNGQYIGILGQSNILPYLSDIQNFFALTGNSSGNLPQQVLVPGTGSALASSQISGMDLVESDLDVEWAASIAPEASILYITSGPRGNVLSALRYAIQTPLIHDGQDVVPVLSMSYSEGCEPMNAPDDFTDDMQLHQQANAQGQTLVFSSGDNGSSGCGAGTVPGQSNPNSYIGSGLAVDYPASSPYVTAAGGTSLVGDRSSSAPFTPQSGLLAQYWSTTNNTTLGSALSYIPEGAWNDALPHVVAGDTYAAEAGGGGGPSELFNASPNLGVFALYGYTGGTLQLPASLSYLAAKPSWQTGPGVPQDNARDLPDLSLHADPDWDAYAICYEEFNFANGSLTGVPSCASPSQIAASNGKIAPFQGPSGSNGGYSIVGGTSAVAPQLAALITLWNQEAGYTNGVGNANHLFYQLAQSNPLAFHDIVPNSSFPGANGNALVCLAGTPSCGPYNGSTTWDVVSGFNVTPGYDMATGLGSVDAAALGKAWGPTSPATLPPDFQVTSQITPAYISLADLTTTVTISVSPLNGYAGAVTLSCQGPAGSGITCNFSGSPTTVVTVGPGNGGTLLTINIASATVTLPNSVVITGTGTVQGASVSHQLVLPVAAATQSTTTTLSASTTSSIYGTPVTLTYTAFANGAPVSGGGFQLNINSVPVPSSAGGWDCTTESAGPCTVTGSDLPVGTNTLTVTYLGNAQYAASTSAPIVVTIAPAPAPTVAAATSSITVAQGSAVASTLTVTPARGFTGTMQVSCSNLPTGATCSFNPSSLTFVNGTAAVSTMTIQTTGTATTAAIGPSFPLAPAKNAPISATVFWLPGLLAMGAFGNKRKQVRSKHWSLILLLLLCLGALTACSGGGAVTPALASPSSPAVASTPTGTYTIQVVVSGTGIQSQTTDLKLIVQ
jgi:hypothetical protein